MVASGTAVPNIRGPSRPTPTGGRSSSSATGRATPRRRAASVMPGGTSFGSGNTRKLRTQRAESSPPSGYDRHKDAVVLTRTDEGWYEGRPSEQTIAWAKEQEAVGDANKPNDFRNFSNRRW